MFSFGTRSRVACWKILCLSLFSLSLFPADPSAAAHPADLFSDDQQAEVATVHVTGKDRGTVVARYLRVLEGDAWKINGVMILEEIQPV